MKPALSKTDRIDRFIDALFAKARAGREGKNNLETFAEEAERTRDFVVQACRGYDFAAHVAECHAGRESEGEHKGAPEDPKLREWWLFGYRFESTQSRAVEDACAKEAEPKPES